MTLHIGIIKDFACLGSIINLNEDCIHEFKRKLRLGSAAMEELGKIKRRDVSLETKAKIIYIKVSPVAMVSRVPKVNSEDGSKENN